MNAWMKTFDGIVIGGGSAGYAAARTLREELEQVAIVDAGAELGGLCILRGCMPSKTLLYSAEVLHLAQRGEQFGIRIGSAAADMEALQRRKRHWVSDFKNYRVEQLESSRFTLLRERAVFVGANRIELRPSGELIEAERIVVATGSRVQFPAIPGLDDGGIWTSDDVLELDQLPESVIVLGGGVVACELSQFLVRIGSRVHQIQRSGQLLTSAASTEAAAVLAAKLRSEGVDLQLGTQLRQVVKLPSGYRVEFTCDGSEQAVEAAHLVNALGRRPAVDGLQLERAGVRLRQNGQIIVDAYQRTSAAGIYAAGDVCGPYEIVHIAVLQGEVAGRVATGRPAEPVNYKTRTAVTFTDPQVALAGQSIGELTAAGIAPIIGEYPFSDHGKSLLMEAPEGFVRAWADPVSGQLLGAECVGKDAGELIHPIAVALSLNAKAEQLLKVHWYHPTLSEIWSYPLEAIAEQLAAGRGG